MFRIGVDVGGTKIRIVVIYKDRVVNYNQMSTPETSANIYNLVSYMYGQMVEEINYAEHTVGIGIPGNVRRPSYLLENTDPLTEFEKALQHSVVVENDANCFALAEAKMGAAHGYKNVFGVILGTGVGGGIVLNGELYSGTSGLVAEWGHNLLKQDGRKCWCGLKGCYERYISGAAIEEEYQRSAGEWKSATEILTMSDVAPLFIRHEFYKNLSTGLANMINVLDPEIIVIGGGLSTVKEIYEVVPEMIEPKLFSKKLSAQIVPSFLTSDAGAIGAALVGV